MIEPALTAGFIGAGMDVTLLGPLPTPAVAMLTRSLRADLGVMISASHNPYEDNGIKLFGPDGTKLSDEMELEIEALMDSTLRRPAGRIRTCWDGRRGWTTRRDAISRRRRPASRAARGWTACASSSIAPTARPTRSRRPCCGNSAPPSFRSASTPDGFNINKGCGSTVPEFLCAKVLEHGAASRHRAGWRRRPADHRR